MGRRGKKPALDRPVADMMFVPFMPDGRVALIVEAPGVLRLPQGSILPGEDPLLDSPLRIPLATAGFRMQHFHPFASEGGRLLAWIEGDRYGGTRPHARPELAVVPPQVAIDMLRRSGLTELAGIVERAHRSRSSISEEEYLEDTVRLLEAAYLRADTPEGGSGFGGTSDEWRLRRGPILDAVDHDGSFLDVGCANGHLMDSIARWAAARGIRLEPYGIDVAPRLVELARKRLPAWADRIWLADAVLWSHPQAMHFDFVHVLLDVVRPHRRSELIGHLLDDVVAAGGRLIVSHYIDPALSSELPAAGILRGLGFDVAGETIPGEGSRAAPSAWIDKR